MRWRTPLILLEVVLAICFVAILLTGAGLWRLKQGPVSIGFATPYVTQVLGEHPSVSVDINDTVLIWSGWRRPVEIRVIGVSARGKDGRLIATVPEMSISFSIKALFQGRLEPTSLDVHRLVVRLVRTADGQIQVGFGRDQANQRAYDAKTLVNLLTRAPDPEKPLGYLRRVRFVDSSVTIEDQSLNISWGISSLSADVGRDRRGITASFDLQTDLEDQKPRLQGTIRYLVKRGLIRTDTHVTGLWPSRLARKASFLEPLRHADFPLEGGVTATIDTAGKLSKASLDLQGGAGSITIPGVYKSPLTIRSVVLRGEMRPAPDRFIIQQFDADLGGPHLGLKAVVTALNGLASVNGDVSLRAVPVADLPRLWPELAAPGARQWVSTNLTDGVVNEASARVIARVSLPDRDVRLDSLSGAMDLKGVTVHYFRPLPPVTGVAATARFSSDSFNFDIREGATGGLRVNNGTVTLSNLDNEEIERVAVVVNLEGQTKDALAILDNPRLKYISRAGIDGRQAKGTMKARLAVSLPLLNDLTLDQVVIDADATLRDLDQPNVAPGINLSGATTKVKVDTAHLVATGEGKLQDIPSRYQLEVRFDDAKDYVVRGKVDAKVTPADVKRTLNVNVASFVDGAMDLDLGLVQRAGQSFEIAGKLGLQDVKLSIPMMDWTKPRGRPGTASFLVSMGANDTPRVQRFDIRTEELQANGSITLRRNNSLSFDRASVDHFVLANNDFRAEIALRSQGGLDINVEGKLLDGERLIDLAKKSGDADSDEQDVPPISLQAKFDEVVLGPGRVVQRVTGEMYYDGEYLRRLRMVSELSPKHHLSFEMWARGKERSVLVTSNDAGAALRRLDIVRNIQDGSLRLTMTRPISSKSQAWNGVLTMRDFTILDAPALAELMSKASLTGLMTEGREIRGNRGNAEFTYQNGKITIKKALSVGSQLGFSVEDGELDMNRDYMYLKGTIIPAYTINKVFGLFSGAPDTGVFAVSYRVQGSIDAPKMRVNPLSAFAPGFLRKMLDVIDYGKEDNSSPTEGINE